MGALDFESADKTPNAETALPVDIAKLVQEARKVVRGDITQNMDEIILSASTAGGMCAKAMISWNRANNDIVTGQGDAPPGYEPWMIKFDGTSEDGRPGPFGRMEYAYGLMAKAAGLNMMPIELLVENGRAHFLTLRFDRDGLRKLHTHSLCGLAHADYNQVGAWSYDLYFSAIRRLQLGQEAMDEGFRRMVFNVIACNRDDHTKNLGFLMVEPGIWQLAPAYDLTYAHGAQWTMQHQMRVNDKVDGIAYADLYEVGEREGVKKTHEIVDQVYEAVRKWDDFADRASLPYDWVRKIQADHLLEHARPKRPRV
jgi:serine/threonine-protein kinase HipA